MSFQLRKPRLSTAAASALAAAAIALTVAGCSQVTPLGPDPAATLPQPRPLGSPVTVEALRGQSMALESGCPADWVAFPGTNGVGNGCFQKTGTLVTSTSAGISSVSSYQPPPPAGGAPAPPAGYAFTVVLPAADAAALTAVTTAVTGAQASTAASPTTAPAGASSLAISVAGKTWVLDEWSGRPAKGWLQIIVPSKNQALQLQRLLAPAN
jgi:hypothetical protein